VRTHEKWVLNMGLISASQRNKVRGTEEKLHHEGRSCVTPVHTMQEYEYEEWSCRAIHS